MVQRTIISTIKSRTSGNFLKVIDYYMKDKDVYLHCIYQNRPFDIPVMRDIAPVGSIGERYVKLFDDYFFINDANDMKGSF